MAQVSASTVGAGHNHSGHIQCRRPDCSSLHIGQCLLALLVSMLLPCIGSQAVDERPRVSRDGPLLLRALKGRWRHRAAEPFKRSRSCRQPMPSLLSLRHSPQSSCVSCRHTRHLLQAISNALVVLADTGISSHMSPHRVTAYPAG